MKHLIVSLTLLCGVSQAQMDTWMHNSATSSSPTISYTTLNQQEQEEAKHWDLTESEWIQYQKYMAVEGKYFYEKVDPLTVMALIAPDEASRTQYIQKQILFERKKIAKEIALANDSWRIQQQLFGQEALVNFQKLPWMDGEIFDRRTIRQDPPKEDVPANQVRSPLKSDAFQPNDELWVIMDQNCDRCSNQIETLIQEQPFNITIISLIKDPNDFNEWIKRANINALLQTNRVRLELYDPLLFQEGIHPKPSQIYHARNGHILRKISD